MNPIDTTNPPNAREPVSPIKIRAGCTLKSKNPNRLPRTAKVIGVYPGCIVNAATEKKVATMDVIPDAKPSKPSVKLTPFTVPITARNRNITNIHSGKMIDL